MELRSDTFTLPTPEMLRAMVTAELGDDVYGEDPTVRELEALAAGMLGKEAGCFMPSGTMSNLATIMTHCPRGSKVIVGEESDIYIYEAGGATACGGVIYHPVPNRADGTMALEEIEDAFPPDPDDPQFAPPELLCLENPQNRCGGKVLPLGYLETVSSFARAHRLAVHLDGSRIFNAALSQRVDASEIASYADSVQFCLSKGLGAPVGSVVVGHGELVGRIRTMRKLLGGGMRQAGVLAAAGIVALKTKDRLVDDHATARYLAEGLAKIPGIAVNPSEVETNMAFFRVTARHIANHEFIAAAEARGVGLAELGHGRIRSVTHQGVEPDDIDYVLDVVRSILEEQPSGASRTRRNHAYDGFAPSG